MSSVPTFVDLPILVEDDDNVQAYIEDELEEDFKVALHHPYTPISSRFVIETDEYLLILNDKERIKVPLNELFNGILKDMCLEADQLQQQAGFFPMNYKQKESTTRCLYALIKEFSQRPRIVSIPIFAWYNYSLMDDSATDESEVIEHIELSGDKLFDSAIPRLNELLKPHSAAINPCTLLVRSALVKEALESLAI